MAYGTQGSVYSLALILFLVFLSKDCVGSSVTGEVETTTNYGKVKGLAIDFENGNGIHVYTGIPFAAPPVGELRFKAPHRPAPWSDVYDATFYRARCYSVGKPTANMNEDCLHINIHLPYKGAGLGPGPYPVMLWIHGGAYINGSAMNNAGHLLAQKGVVVAMFNYRTQALGFLNTGDDTARGNYGMLDQQAAMQFVKENIAAFSGDPDDITIFGQSAGGTSAGLHLVAPKSIPMYQKAILQSGSDMASWAMIEPEWRPSDYSRSLAEDLGCPTVNSTEMVGCLRGLPAADISKAALDVLGDLKLGAIHVPWAPVVDGPDGFLPDTPANLRARGQFAKVPLMGGFTSNEHGGIPFGENVSRDEFLDFIRSLVDFLAQNNTQQQFDALSFEYTYWPDVTNGPENRKRALNILNDFMFTGPVDVTSKYHYDINDTFLFMFGYHSLNHPEPAYTAVQHGGELPYVFGYPFFDENLQELTGIRASYNYTDEDRSFSEKVMTMWSNFAKYGNPTPSPVGGVTWDKATSSHIRYLNIDREWGSLLNWRQHKYAFSTQFFPKIVKYKICNPESDEKHPRIDQLIRGNKRKEPTSERKTNKESRISKMKKFKNFVDIVFKNAN